MQESLSSSASPAPIRASRKSEWLRSALAHHYDPDPGVENEIVVLATGIDQYLQEVFHHLAFRDGSDLVTAEDFGALCQVLGIFNSRDGAGDKGEADETAGVLSGLPARLRFGDFHARLCGHFSLRAERRRNGGGRPDASARLLPVTEETEHVEREIRLRWPRARKRKSVSFDLSRDGLPSDARRTLRHAPILKPGNLHNCAGQKNLADSSLQGAALQRAEMENAGLRELVEDLRAALQASDARCLALEVSLRRERGGAGRAGGEEPRLAAGAGVTAVTAGVGARDLLRELELIRASRDGQLAEAMRFSQRLEAELGEAGEESRRLEGAVLRLRREREQTRRRAEGARAALACGLDRVREIQEQAAMVPALQARVRQLEADRLTDRSRCTCRANRDEWDGSAAMTPEPGHIPLRHSPTGRDEPCSKGVEEGLQRAVEGRAASDEEEEERGSEEGQCCLVEVKRMVNRLRCSGKGCQNTGAHHLLISQACFHANPHSGITAALELRGRGHKGHTHPEEKETELGKSLPPPGQGPPLRQQQEEVETLRVEVQVVETERVRLSLLEEKLTDALTLLLQLRAKDISRRALGRIVMDTLDVCSKAGHGPSHTLQVVDALWQQLLTCELLTEEAGLQTGGDGDQREGADRLLIS